MDVNIYRSARTTPGRPGASWSHAFDPIDEEEGILAGSGDDPIGAIEVPDGTLFDKAEGRRVLCVRQGGPGSGYAKVTADDLVGAARRGEGGYRIVAGLDEGESPAGRRAGAAKEAGSRGAKAPEPPGPTITYHPGDMPELLPPGTADGERETVHANLAALARAYIEHAYPGCRAECEARAGESGSARKGAKVDGDEAALGGRSKDEVLDDVDHFVRKHARHPDLRKADFDAGRLVAAASPAAVSRDVPQRGYRPADRPGGTDHAGNGGTFTLHEVDDGPDDRVAFVACDDSGRVRMALDDDGKEVRGASTVKADYDVGAALGRFAPADGDALQGLIAGGDGKGKPKKKDARPKKDR